MTAPDSRPARRLDGYLSQIAQPVEPRAQVYRPATHGAHYVLECGDDPPVALGRQFGQARQAVRAWAIARQATHDAHAR